MGKLRCLAIGVSGGIAKLSVCCDFYVPTWSIIFGEIKIFIFNRRPNRAGKVKGKGADEEYHCRLVAESLWCLHRHRHKVLNVRRGLKWHVSKVFKDTLPRHLEQGNQSDVKQVTGGLLTTSNFGLTLPWSALAMPGSEPKPLA